MNKFIITLILSTFTSLVFSQNIDFTQDNNKGCSPLSVNFSIINYNSNYSYLWIFGNGNTSTLSNPKALYSNPGNYTIKLIVFENGFAIDTIEKLNHIKVFKNPVANFWTTTSRQGCVPLEVGFINNSTATDTTIVEKIWAFGDGQMSYENNPVYTYNYEGYYNVSLKIMDANGCEDSKFYSNLIKTSNIPVVNFTADIKTSCDTPLEVNFQNLTASNYQFTSIWTVSNNMNSNEKNPKILFNQFGDFDVTLNIIDENGCSNTISKSSFIKLGEIKSSFYSVNDSITNEAKRNFCKNENIYFRNTSTYSKYTEWDFGDGQYSFDINPTHKYNSSGTYIIKLKSFNDTNCYDEKIDTIIIDKVKASFTCDGDYICSNPANISYINSSEFANSYLWKFGNGDTSTSYNPTNTFQINQQNALLTDTLIAYSIDGCSDTIFYNDNLRFNLPKAYFTPNNSSEFSTQIKGCIPFTVNFNNISTYNSTVDSIISYQWSFGDTSSSSIFSPIKQYTDVGEYEVKLIATTARGCQSEFKALVKTGTVQQASFNIQGNNNVCASTAIQFIDQSADSELINEWHWNFGDGTISKEQNPLHYFNSLGSLPITLTVGHNGCLSQTFTINNAVNIKGPIGTLQHNFSCDNQYHYNFNTNPQQASSWLWEFGDGAKDSTNQTNVSHDYTYSNDYLINLTLKNDTNGCTFTKQNIISVRNLKSIVYTDTLIGCPGLTVKFYPDSCIDAERLFLNNNNYYFYKWELDNSTINSYSNDYITRKFNTKGVHPVKLLVKAVNNCTAEYTKYIKIYKPDIDFTTSSNSYCAPLNVNIIPSIQSDTLFTLKWDFGDSTISTNINNIHTYYNPGKYNIKLTVRDTLSCTSSIEKDSIVNSIRTKPNFSASILNTCVGKNIQFTNHNHSDSLIYFWDFGDGTYSNEISPIHSYNIEDNFDVSLKLSYPSGCDSTLSMNDFIKIQDFPIANFKTDTTFSDCYPFLVRFTDMSQYDKALTYKWDFGDNLNSTFSNPTHSYIVPGNFNIKLIVYSEFGCSDTIIKDNHINVGGPFAEIIKPDIICKGSEFNFSIGNKININNFSWDLGDGHFSEDEIVNHIYNQFGKIYPTLLVYSDTMFTCNKVIRDSVLINEIIARLNIKDSAKCVFTPILFSDSSINAINYKWLSNNNLISNEKNTSFTFESPGTRNIKLIVSDQFGCKDSTFQNLVINPLPTIKICNDTLICKGDFASLSASGGEFYKWSPENDLNYADLYNPLANPDKNTEFTVEVIDNNQCTNYKSTIVNVQQIPEITISNDTSIVIGEVVKLFSQSQENATYTWEPNIGLSCNKCQNPSSRPLEDIEYTLTVNDSINCFSVTEKISIEILKKYTIDVPTVFTPNGDGINDIITPKGWGIHMIADFKVFNKWGEVVFQSNEKNNGWNGYYKGKLQENDTYVYYVEAITFDGKKISKKGNFVLMK